MITMRRLNPLSPSIYQNALTTARLRQKPRASPIPQDKFLLCWFPAILLKTCVRCGLTRMLSTKVTCYGGHCSAWHIRIRWPFYFFLSGLSVISHIHNWHLPETKVTYQQLKVKRASGKIVSDQRTSHWHYNWHWIYEEHLPLEICYP